MCGEIYIPIDPVVKFVHETLFRHENIVRKVERAEKDSSNNNKSKYTANLEQSLYTRTAMQISAISGAALSFALGLFCTKLHLDPTISYYLCLLVCLLVGYTIGMFAGAIYGRASSIISTASSVEV